MSKLVNNTMGVPYLNPKDLGLLGLIVVVDPSEVVEGPFHLAILWMYSYKPRLEEVKLTFPLRPGKLKPVQPSISYLPLISLVRSS